MYVTGQTLNNGIKSLKCGQRYIYICIVPNIYKTPHGYTNEFQYHERPQRG